MNWVSLRNRLAPIVGLALFLAVLTNDRLAVGQPPAGRGGPPGGPVAYAHVGSNGVLDLARSKNVVAMTPAGPYGAFGPFFCFVLNVVPVNVVATEAISDSFQDPYGAPIAATLAGTPEMNSYPSCPAGTASWRCAGTRSGRDAGDRCWPGS